MEFHTIKIGKVASILKKMINKLLKNELDVLSVNECALLLSGGVDSISVGFAAHQLGKTINAYSFQLKENPSDDFAKAKQVSEIMGWKFTGIQIDKQNLNHDFHTLLKLGCEKKTHFECSFPFLYVYPKIKQKYVLSGWGADGYFGISKKAHLKYKVRESKKQFDEFRDSYFQKNECAGYEVHKKVAKNWNKIFIAPYLSEKIRKYFYKFDWYELNKPYEKHLVRNAFKEFKLIGKVNKHSNLQLNAKIPDYFETLINDKTINFNFRTRLIDICRDWVKKSKTNSLEMFMN